MPHFGHYGLVGMYFKKLLVCFHGGYLWLNKPYEVMVDLISAIIGLSQNGIHSDLDLHNEGAKIDKNDMKDKYQLLHIISSI